MFGRLVTEECYPWRPWDGRMASCDVTNKRSNNDLNVSCPRSAKTSQLRRVGLMYRVDTEEGIMNEIMNWGSVQGVYLYCNLSHHCYSVATSYFVPILNYFTGNWRTQTVTARTRGVVRDFYYVYI